MNLRGNVLNLAVLTFLVLTLAVLTSAEVRFAWRANTEPDLAGYRLYYGPESRAYTNVAVFGLVTNGCVVSGRQYFALTAVNSNLVESEFSIQLLYNPLRLVIERSVDGVLWDAVATNEVAPLRAFEFFRLRLDVTP